MCLQPVVHCRAHAKDLVQVRGQEIHPTCVQNLVVHLGESFVFLREVDEHVVVSMLGLQHENNLLQVLQVDLLWTSGRAEDGDDAFGDVRQIYSQLFLHD